LRPLAFFVPGRLDQITGGYLYDRRVVEGLRRAGRAVAVHELAGCFPDADAAARDAFSAALAGLPDGGAVAIDGLALPGGVEAVPREAPRLRLVAFVHHPLALESGLAPAASHRFAELEARLLRPCRGAICPSRRTADALVGYGMDPARIAVVPPGTDAPLVDFPPLLAGEGQGGGTPPTESSRLAPPPTPTLPRKQGREKVVELLSVGTITPRKGHAVLVEALAGLADLDWRLTCIGSLDRDPGTVAGLLRLIERHGLRDRVLLPGEWPPERLSRAYAAADIFVLASFHEGYGMAFAEAMAHGLPIVGTDAGAVPETVPAGAGVLVPAGDAAALRRALRQVLGDPALRQELAEGARRAAAALPSWDETVRRWGEAFDRLAA
jgi:glycosyltransferase involved in cell wall biosynthesis